MRPNVVVVATDANFFPPAAFLVSRLAELNDRDDVEIILLTDSESDKRIANAFGVPAQVGHVGMRLPNPGSRFPPASYLRVIAPAMLPAARRILYLDADVYPESDRFLRLFDLDMHGYPIAAVRALSDDFVVRGGSTRTFNSGVLLIDRERFCAARLTDAIMDVAVSRRLLDQDAFNAAIPTEWLELSPAMNMTPLAAPATRRALPATITHFAGPAKAWHEGATHPSAPALKAYIDGSPWRGWRDRFQPSNSRPLPQIPMRAKAAIEQYLRTTRFADVEQGITPAPHLSAPAP